MLEDAAGLAELRRLGARSVPVLSRGDAFVFAQNFADVVKFLGLREATGPTLAPGELIERLDRFLSAAARLITQMPDAMLQTEVLNRPRTYRMRPPITTEMMADAGQAARRWSSLGRISSRFQGSNSATRFTG